MGQFAVLFALLTLLLTGAFSYLAQQQHTYAQDRQCWPEMKRVHDSMEDLQRVRILLEEQNKILRELRDLQKRPKR